MFDALSIPLLHQLIACSFSSLVLESLPNDLVGDSEALPRNIVPKVFQVLSAVTTLQSLTPLDESLWSTRGRPQELMRVEVEVVAVKHGPG